MSDATRVPRRGPGSGGVTGRGFQPGHSGNPGGRPRGFVAAIRDATNDGEELVTFVLKVFRGESIGTGKGAQRPRLADRLAAATWLADRGFGRPIQAVENTVRTEWTYDLSRLTDDELAQFKVLVEKVELPSTTAGDRPGAPGSLR